MNRPNWRAAASACAAEVFRKGLGPCGVLTDEALGVTVFYQNAPFPCRHRVLAELEQKLEEARITRFATVSYPVGGPADGQTVLMLLDGGRDEDVRAIASRTMKVRKTGR